MNRAQRPARRGRSNAQALVELALVVPMMIVLFIGVSTAATFIADRQIAGQAVRSGARLAAEDGNAQYTPGQAPIAGTCMTTGADPCVVDSQVIHSVVTAARSLSSVSSVDEIDIYEPCAGPGVPCSSSNPDTEACTYTRSSLDGSFQAGDPVDVYKANGSGSFALAEPAGDTQYTLDRRNQSHPLESTVGVRIIYTFRSSTPMNFFNFQTSEYATMCLAPDNSTG